MQFFLITTLCALSTVSSVNSNNPSVTTSLGKINGYYKISYEGRQYAAYESIPYALPPIGNLRFEPPVPVTVWAKSIDALSLPKPCSQYEPIPEDSTTGVEDCLYINIYTPAKIETESLPVIFWIHGGGFQYGMSSDYREKFLMDRDLILVTFNYRVGPFGFLSTGDDVVPGNMGLKDQSLALRWVFENIRYFGGDPKRITLAGDSAGGASVHHHYLSPLSAGLFQNGISLSGTTLARWAFTKDTSNTTKILAKALKCPVNNSSKIIECLKKAPATKITQTIKNLLSDFYFSYVMFTPVAEKVKDNYFINDTPKNIIEQGRVSDVPWIAGVVSEEGLYITGAFALNKEMIERTNKNWETIAPYMLHFVNNVPEDKHAKLANAAKRHYFGNENFSTNRDAVKTLTHMTGDDQIVTGAIRAAKLQARVNKSPVHFYYYSYRAAQSMSEYFSKTTENLGICHGDDVFMVMENNFMNPTTTTSDKIMLRHLLDFWESVASTGKPNLGTNWPRLNSSRNFKYMHIAGPGNFTMKTNNNLGEIQFWEQTGL